MMTDEQIAEAAAAAGDELVSWTVRGMDLIVCTLSLKVLAEPKTRAEADDIVKRIDAYRSRKFTESPGGEHPQNHH